MSFTRSEVAGGSWSTPFGTPFFVWNGDGFTKIPMDRLRAEYIAWEQTRLSLSMMTTVSGPEPVAEVAKPASSSWADEVEDELFGGDEIEDPVANAVNTNTAVEPTADMDGNPGSATVWGIKDPAPKSWADDVEDELFGGCGTLEDNAAPSSPCDTAGEGCSSSIDALIDGLSLLAVGELEGDSKAGIKTDVLGATSSIPGDDIQSPGPSREGEGITTRDEVTNATLDVSVLEHETCLDSSIDSLWSSQFETMLDDIITSESKWNDFWKALFSREAESLLEEDGDQPPNAMGAGDCKSGLDGDDKDMDDAGEGDIKALAPPSFASSSMISTSGGKGGLEPGSGGSLDSRVRWGRQWRAFHTGCWRGGLSESWGDEAGVSVAKALDVMDEDAAGQKTKTRTTNGWDLDWRLAGGSGLEVQGPRGSFVLTEAVSSVEKETVCGRRRDGLTQRRSAKTECTRRAGVHGKAGNARPPWGPLHSVGNVVH